MWNSDFDKEYESTKRWMIFLQVIFIIIGLSLIGFGVWVVIKLLQYFKVI